MAKNGTRFAKKRNTDDEAVEVGAATDAQPSRSLGLGQLSHDNQNKQETLLRPGIAASHAQASPVNKRPRSSVLDHSNEYVRDGASVGSAYRESTVALSGRASQFHIPSSPARPSGERVRELDSSRLQVDRQATSLQQQLDTKNALITRQAKDIESLKALLASSQDKMDQSKRDLADLEEARKKIEELEDQISSLQEDLETSTLNVVCQKGKGDSEGGNEGTKSMSAVLELNKLLEATNEQLRLELSSITAQQAFAIGTDVEDLKRRLRSSEAECNALDRNLQDLRSSTSAEIKALKDTCELLQTELSETRQRLSVAEMAELEVDSYREECDKLKTQNQQLTQAKTALAAQAEHLGGRVQKLEEANRQLEELRFKLAGSLQVQSDKNIASMNAFQAQQSANNEEIRRLQEEVFRLRTSNQSCVARQENAERGASTHVNENRRLKEENEALKRQTTDLARKNVDEQTNGLKVEKQLREEVCSLTKQLADAKRDKDIVAHQRDTMADRLKYATNHHPDPDSEVGKLQTALEKQKEAITDLEAQVAMLRRDKASLESRINSLNSSRNLGPISSNGPISSGGPASSMTGGFSLKPTGSNAGFDDNSADALRARIKQLESQVAAERKLRDRLLKQSTEELKENVQPQVEPSVTGEPASHIQVTAEIKEFVHPVTASSQPVAASQPTAAPVKVWSTLSAKPSALVANQSLSAKPSTLSAKPSATQGGAPLGSSGRQLARQVTAPVLTEHENFASALSQVRSSPFHKRDAQRVAGLAPQSSLMQEHASRPLQQHNSRSLQEQTSKALHDSAFNSLGSDAMETDVDIFKAVSSLAPAEPVDIVQRLSHLGQHIDARLDTEHNVVNHPSEPVVSMGMEIVDAALPDVSHVQDVLMEIEQAPVSGFASVPEKVHEAGSSLLGAYSAIEHSTVAHHAPDNLPAKAQAQAATLTDHWNRALGARPDLNPALLVKESANNFVFDGKRVSCKVIGLGMVVVYQKSHMEVDKFLELYYPKPSSARGLQSSTHAVQASTHPIEASLPTVECEPASPSEPEVTSTAQTSAVHGAEADKENVVVSANTEVLRDRRPSADENQPPAGANSPQREFGKPINEQPRRRSSLGGKPAKNPTAATDKPKQISFRALRGQGAN